MDSQRSRDLNELKRQALNFYSKNADVVKHIEEALNSLFYDSPYDIYGYLSEHFAKFCKPALFSKIIATTPTYFDSKSQPIFRLEIFCQEKNIESKILTLNSICHSADFINDSTRVQHIQDEDIYRANKLNEIINFINLDITDIVKNYSPFAQNEIDEKLTLFFLKKQKDCLEKFIINYNNEINYSQAEHVEGKKSKTPTSPKQKAKARKTPSVQANQPILAGDELQIYFNSNYFALFTLSLISKAVLLASASIGKCHPFERMLQITSSHEKDKYKMPIPMITLLQNGKGFNGKQNLVKEFILLPRANLKVQEGIDMISKINKNIRDTLYQSKIQPGAINRCVTDQGSLTCLLETPQQGIDLIDTSINTTFGSEFVSHLNMALNISANEFYDTEKGKYEVAAGVLKSADELIDIYIELIGKYPRIVMIIDPFNYNDPLSWYKLYTRISKKCLIASNIKSNEVFNRKLNENFEELNEFDKSTESHKIPDIIKQASSLSMPVTFFKFENAITLSSIAALVKEKEDANLLTGLSSSFNETDDAFLADLSVGNQVNYIKIGGFNRYERVSKLNRLIEIEAYLNERNLLAEPSGEIHFPNDFEIPSEYAESIQNYQSILEDSKNPKATVKK